MSPQDKAREIDAALDAKARKDAEEKAEEKKTAERKMDAEHNGETLNKILSCLDSLSSRMDAYGARLDGAEAALDKRKKKDAEEEKGEAERLPRQDGLILTHRGGEPVGEEEGDPRPLGADSRHDSLPRSISDSQRDELAEIQSRADSVCSAWGQEVRRPMMNELPCEYRRRVAMPLKQYSAQWKDVDLKELGGGKALEVAVDQIFKDAFAAASANETYEHGDLRMVRRVNRDTGHVVKEFYGSPMSWMQQFTGGRRLARFNTDLMKRGK